MNTTTNTQALTFTAGELTALTVATQHAFFQLGARVRWTVEGDDGDAWAALEVHGQDQDRRMGWHLAFTVQLTTEPGRRFVALAADGLEVVQAGDNLPALLADLLAPQALAV
jgi:hypothetical protein